MASRSRAGSGWEPAELVGGPLDGRRISTPPQTEIVVMDAPSGGDLLVVYRRAGERDGRALFSWSRLARGPAGRPGRDRGRAALERAGSARARAVTAAARAAEMQAAAAALQARHAERLLARGDLDGAELAVERACAARAREIWARSCALRGVSPAEPG